MNTLFRTAAFIFSMFTIALACTKEIELKTEVEFTITEEHEANGYVGDSLATMVTVIPEVILEEFTYSYAYTVSEGSGHFQNRAGEVLPQNENIPLNSLSATMMYVGTEAGEHTVKIMASDNYGFTEQVDIVYSLSAIPPVIWTATSAVQRIELGNSAPIIVNFEKSEANEDINYERRYTMVAGSGTFSNPSAEAGAETDYSEYRPILPSSYTLYFEPSELGIMELSFDLKGDNGETYAAALNFEVLEEIIDRVPPEIQLLENSIIIERGSTFTDPGATATDDVDGDISDKIVVDASQVNFSVVGTYEVTYNVSDSANNMATEAILTVNVIAGENPQNTENDILAFALPGQNGTSDINQSTSTVTLNVPFGTNLNVAPASLSTSPLASIAPAGEERQNFETPVIYRVTSENGATREWTVTVNTITSTDRSIERFTIDGVDGVISGTNIMVTLPAGSDSGSLKPTIIFTGNELMPSSESAQDFTDSITYTVTAQDDTTTDYLVTVIMEESTEKEITRFVVNGVLGTISGTDINVTLPSGNDEKSLSPDIVHTGGTISPIAGATLDFSRPIIYTVTAEDGGIESYTVNLVVENDRPEAVASVNPSNALLGQDVSFRGDSSSDDIEISSYFWDFGDGMTSTEVNPVHRYTSYNSFTVTLTVTDDGGLSDTDTETVRVANEAPTAVAGSDKMAGFDGLTVNFDSSRSTDDNRIESYRWDFEDGSTSDEANPTHVFNGAGEYRVRLTVSDGELTSTDIIIITVYSFDQATGRLIAPLDSEVVVSLTTTRTAAGVTGSAEVLVNAARNKSGLEYLSIETTNSTSPTSFDENFFFMPVDGIVYFYGRHSGTGGISFSAVEITVNGIGFDKSISLTESSPIQN